MSYTATVSAHEARKNFATLMELAYYKNAQIRIKRNQKPFARLVGEPLMQDIDKVIDFLIKYKPAIADTLAIMLDENLKQLIDQGTKEVKAGKTIPLESILED